MGWQCLTTKPPCDDTGGFWNSQGVAYFDISNEILSIHDKIIQWLLSIAPVTYAVFFGVILAGFVLLVLLAVKQGMKNA